MPMDDELSGVSAAAGFASVKRLLAEHKIVRVHNTSGAFQALLAAQLPAPLLAVTADEAQAQALTRDLRFFVQSQMSADDPQAVARVAHLPYVETAPWDDISPDRRAILSRMATLFRLSQGQHADVLVASAPALARRVIPRASFSDLVDVVQKGEEIDRDTTLKILVRGGFTRSPVVEDAGTFAVRGGVIDVFVPLYRFPLRIELFGDTVESIRFFDPETQRTMRAVDEIYLHPVRETVLTRGNKLRDRLLEAGDHAHHPSSKTRAILDQIDKGEDFFGVEALTPAFHERLASIAEYLPASQLVFVDEPDACIEAVAAMHEEGERAYRARVDEHRLAFTPDEFYLSPADLQAIFDRGKRVEAHQLEVAGSDVPVIRFAVEPHRDLAIELQRARAEKHEELLRPLARRLRDWRDAGVRALVAVPNPQHAERLESLLKGYRIIPHVERVLQSHNLLEPGAQRTNVEIVLGQLGHGFVLPLDGVALLSEQEIFGEKAVRSATKKRRAKGFKQDDFKNLQPGDFVVHTLHGVGIYKGLTKLPLRSAGREVAVDFLQLEYEGGALYLPVWRLNEVQALRGRRGRAPEARQARRRDLEEDQRQGRARKCASSPRSCCSCMRSARRCRATRSRWRRRRRRCSASSRRRSRSRRRPISRRRSTTCSSDIEHERPMDRLVCGDVGYGKTEVAMRAALKAVLGGKQVAVLAPTTVLVEQHASNFAARYTRAAGERAVAVALQAAPRAAGDVEGAGRRARSTSSSARIACCRPTCASRTWGSSSSTRSSASAWRTRSG